MVSSSYSLISKVMAILIAAHSVYSVSKRKLKEQQDKPKEPPVHLTLSYDEIKSEMVNFKFKDFAEVATGHRRIFVHFSSNADPEGLRALRGFYGAYQRLIQKDLNITWGLVDCDEDRQMCMNQDIHFTPQYWLYINKRRVNYTAGRSPYLVSDWIYKTIKYPGTFIDRRNEIKQYEKEQDRFFFYVGWMDSDYDFYREIAASYPFYLWISCFDRDRMMHANGIYWYEPPTNSQDMRNGPHGELVMLNFTLKYFQNLKYMSNYHLERVFVHERTAIFIFYPDTNEERGIQMAWWPAAMDMKWSILCWQVPVGIPEPDLRKHRLMEFLGISNPQSVAVRLLALKDGRWDVYQMKNRITTQSILQFYDQFQKGQLTPFWKSAVPPTEHRSGEIRTVVGRTFQKYIYNHEHDSVVIFHSPNCTVCDRLLKIGKVAVHVLSRYDDVQISEVNVQINAGEAIPTQYLPELQIFKKHDKLNPMTYTGLYNARDIIAWICDTIGKDNPFEEEMGQKIRDKQQSQDEGKQDI